MSERQKPWAITQEELDLRFDYRDGKMSLREFNRRYESLKKQGKIRRSGRAIQ